VKQVLIADDEAHNRALLNHALTREGYKVIEAGNGEEAIRLLKQHLVDMAIVDIRMPGVDGLQVCEHIRSNYNIPVILLTACDQLSDKEQGFKCGADDYVTKPYEPSELLYRIKALFRRYLLASNDRIVLNRVVIDRQNFEVVIGDHVLILPLKEFELLAQLAQYAGRLFGRDELIYLVWGSDYAGDERTVDVHIKRIRKRFISYADSFVIHTVRGIGYKLEVMP